MLREGKKSDADILAKIHLLEFSSQFLPSLGEKFLCFLYVNLLQNKDVYVLIEHANNEVKGFIVGSKDFSTVFKKVIINNFMRFTFLIIPRILKKPRIIKNIFETLFYTKKEGENTPKAELVVISVSKKYHRQGIGKKLVLGLEKKFVSKHIKLYKVSASAKNAVANLFYRSLAFKKSHDFSLYGEKVNLYTKQLK